jgi:hypothetical protein
VEGGSADPTQQRSGLAIYGAEGGGVCVITIWLMAIIGANFEGDLPQTSVVDGLPVFRYHISVFGHQHLAHQRVEIIP